MGPTGLNPACRRALLTGLCCSIFNGLPELAQAATVEKPDFLASVHGSMGLVVESKAPQLWDKAELDLR